MAAREAFTAGAIHYLTAFHRISRASPSSLSASYSQLYPAHLHDMFLIGINRGYNSQEKMYVCRCTTFTLSSSESLKLVLGAQ